MDQPQPNNIDGGLPTRVTGVVHRFGRRGSLGVAGLASVATALLMLGAQGAWHLYAQWRLGRIALTTAGPALAAEVLPASSSDRPMGEPFDIGTRTVLTLPAGDYRLRVKATGLMSQTYRVAVNRGETRTHHLTPDDNRMLGSEPIPFSLVTEAVTLTPGKADFIEWNGETLIRRAGSTGKPVWDAARPPRSMGTGRDPVAAIRRLSRFGDEKRPGQLVQPATDVDGDGTGDLIWAIKGTPSLLALSGKDGSVLWTYSADPDPARTALRPAGRSLCRVESWERQRWSMSMATAPIDLIAELAIFEDSNGLLSGPVAVTGTDADAERIISGRRVVAAVSGRSGKEIWKYVIDATTPRLCVRRRPSTMAITYVSRSKGSFLGFGDDPAANRIGLDPATGRPQFRPSINLGFAGPTHPVLRRGRRCLCVEIRGSRHRAWRPLLAEFWPIRSSPHSR